MHVCLPSWGRSVLAGSMVDAHGTEQDMDGRGRGYLLRGVGRAAKLTALLVTG